MVAVLENDDRVLMMWRHRFIIDRWVWELPGGYVDADENTALAATREVEEETGWRPNVEFLGSFQPMIGSADAENLLYVAHGADYVGDKIDVNEAARVEWIPLASVRDLMASGEIVGAGSQVALLRILCRQHGG